MLSPLKRLGKLIDRSVMWQGGGIAILTIIGAGLEALGVGLLFPFMKFVSDPNATTSFPLAQTVFAYFNTDIYRDKILILSFALILFFLFKNIFLVAIQYLHNWFVSSNEAMLSIRLFRAYLAGAYALHLERNSAEFIRNVNSAVPTVFGSVLMGYTNLFSETLLAAAIIITLLVVETTITLFVVGFLGLGVAAYYIFVRNRLALYGILEQAASGNILQHLQQGFHSIKESKVLDRISFMVRAFQAPRLELARVMIKKKVLVGSSKMWIETITVTAVLSVLIAGIYLGLAVSEIIAILAIYAAAAFRMVPSMNRIVIALNGIRNGQHALFLVSDDIDTFTKNVEIIDRKNVDYLPFNNTITFENLSFRYETAERESIRNISLSIAKGTSIGIVGPSGAGKTTLMDILLGLLMPTSGRILVDGENIAENLYGWRKHIGYVPQSIYINDDTLRNNVVLGLPPEEFDPELFARAIALAQLEPVIAKLEHGVDTRIGERGARLSGGQIQRVGIARALYNNPDVLIFDEATSALDNETEYEITRAIENLMGMKTIFIIAHRLSTVRNCNHIVVLKDGVIDDHGGFDDLAKRNETFRTALDRMKAS